MGQQPPRAPSSERSTGPDIVAGVMMGYDCRGRNLGIRYHLVLFPALAL